MKMYQHKRKKKRGEGRRERGKGGREKAEWESGPRRE